MNKRPATPQPERRNLTHEFRVSPDGEKPTISGYAALFDSPSEDMGGWTETIDAHAFDSVLNSNPDVRALWNHNPDHILGRTTANTLTLTLDGRGLSYTIDPPDTTLAKDLVVSMRRKDVTGSSFGFICKRDQWTEMSDGTVQRRILEFDTLLDVSPVTYPAYTGTTSQSGTLPSTIPAEFRSRIAKRDLDATDDDLDDCECACPECADGDCERCSAETPCKDEQRSTKISDSEVRRLQMKLMLLSL